VTNASALIRVAQLSDTHFLEKCDNAEGGFGYDTAEAFEAVRGMAGGHTHVPDAYEFTPDGSVSGNVHLVDDERWPRRPLG
jgi:hypothetical protein